MKVAGIIAEYNPFHKGHQYHIEQTRKQTGADYIVAVMSGDFVQRGEPALIDKYDRVRSALLGGCDLVIELPIIYSTASAEFFASGAVLLLSALQVCDFLSFGSEEGSLSRLLPLADLLLLEPAPYREALQEGLKRGLSFPKAREEALISYLKGTPYCQFYNEFTNCIKSPNNILALEYLKALKKNACSMEPVTISRKNASYHDKKLYEEISSATAIRYQITSQKDLSFLQSSVPQSTYESLQKASASHSWLSGKELTPFLHSQLLSVPNGASILDMGTELWNRLQKLDWPVLDFPDLCLQLKSRQVTAVRIQRSLLHLILDIRQNDFMTQYESCPVP